MDPTVIPDEKTPLFRQRVDMVDVVSILRVRIMITYRKVSMPEKTKQVSSTKIQVKRSDTVDSIVQGIREDNDVDKEAALEGPAVYDSFKLTQSGIHIRGNQTAALLFDDRYSNVADADVNFVYSYTPPTVACVTIQAAFVAVEEKPLDPELMAISASYTMQVDCNTTVFDISQRVRLFNDADSKALIIGGEKFDRIKCFQGGDIPANVLDRVKAYFTDPYKPEVSLIFCFYYTKAPSSSCCIIM